MNLEVSATTNLPNKKNARLWIVDFSFPISSGLHSCAVEKFSHFGCGFLLEISGEVDYWYRLISDKSIVFLFRFFSVDYNLTVSLQERICLRSTQVLYEENRHVQPTFRTSIFFFLILDLWRAKPFVNTLDSALF